MRKIKHIAIIIIYALLAVPLWSCLHKKFQNHLSNSSSPYLQEHADNPVDWFEWSDETLALAKKENKPLLISIGYSSCHWCHVMEKESFMDTAVARIMNENFINIKVDREERPDIDNIYINAAQLLTGNAGWPLNAFALPDGKPFYAVTYSSKEGWKNMLKQIAQAYKQQNKKVVLQAQALTNGIVQNELTFTNKENTPATISRSFYQNLFDSLYKKIDLNNGGLKGIPKFPLPTIWEFLLQYQYLTGDKTALNAITNTLNKMALGTLYDQAGGGFARYTADSLWRVPHFEKMLYDNAQLASLYTHAYQVTGNNFFKTIAKETLVFVAKEMTSPDGGFYSSLNADTENGEGEFYTWTHDEIKKNLPQSDVIISYFNIKADGNIEGLDGHKNKNLLYASYTPEKFAAKNKIPPIEFNNLLNSSKKTLLSERNKRIKPTVDDKILTAWNALMLKAYADAYAAFDDEDYLKTALATASFIEKKMIRSDGHLWRNYRNGKMSIDGFLDDYALLAKAYIRLYQVSFDKHWLSLAQKIVTYAINNFYNKNEGMFYYTADSVGLPVRKMDIADNVTPSSNAIMAEVLYNLGVYFEKDDYIKKSVSMVLIVKEKMSQTTSYYSQWCYMAGILSHGTNEVAIMGKEAVKKNMEMQKKYLPKCIFMGGTDEDLPLLENKLSENHTLIYVCTNKTCKLPVENVNKALLQIK